MLLFVVRYVGYCLTCAAVRQGEKSLQAVQGTKPAIITASRPITKMIVTQPKGMGSGSQSTATKIIPTKIVYGQQGKTQVRYVLHQLIKCFFVWFTFLLLLSVFFFENFPAWGTKVRHFQIPHIVALKLHLFKYPHNILVNHRTMRLSYDSSQTSSGYSVHFIVRKNFQ